MKERINYTRFCEAFEELGRGNQYSDYGFQTLFAYLEQLEDENGEEVELDLIFIASNFMEMDKAEAAERAGLPETAGWQEIIDALDKKGVYIVILPVKKWNNENSKLETVSVIVRI